MSLLDRIIDKAHSLFYSRKRYVSLSSRLVALMVAFLTITTVFPSIAEEGAPVIEAVEPAQTPVPQSSEQNLEAATPEPSSSPQDASPTPSPTNSEQGTEEEDEEVKIVPVEVQPQITFRFPPSLAHDPRASVAFLPQLSITGGSVGLLCLSSNGVIDIATKNLVNNSLDGEFLVMGDLSTQVRIAGQLNQIIQFMNQSGGIKISAASGRLSSTIVTARYVELTGVDAALNLCGSATNARSIGFRPLGLQMDTVKTRVDFNKPSGK